MTDVAYIITTAVMFWLCMLFTALLERIWSRVRSNRRHRRGCSDRVSPGLCAPTGKIL